MAARWCQTAVKAPLSARLAAFITLPRMMPASGMAWRASYQGAGRKAVVSASTVTSSVGRLTAAAPIKACQGPARRRSCRLPTSRAAAAIMAATVNALTSEEAAVHVQRHCQRGACAAQHQQAGQRQVIGCERDRAHAGTASSPAAPRR
ncbi:hypothetical protein OR16_36805 [Cupriavidus basilensis OR16]|uniref:Uncharacterized protein n=1 Tax=Cupriavidus basilensis OR16 TaxID=1127483 RepID=H1SG58_9BURK|nr:hypothetical protein OR16_36805 [Cupriavidus basilensis OR16]